MAKKKITPNTLQVEIKGLKLTIFDKQIERDKLIIQAENSQKEINILYNELHVKQVEQNGGPIKDGLPNYRERKIPLPVTAASRRYRKKQALRKKV